MIIGDGVASQYDFFNYELNCQEEGALQFGYDIELKLVALSWIVVVFYTEKSSD